MTPAMKLAGAAVLVVAAVAGTLYLFGNPGGIGSDASPSSSSAPSAPALPTASATPEPTPVDGSSWVEYTSAVYGSIIKHPADWEISPATHAFEFDQDAAVDFLGAAADGFLSPESDILVSVFTAPVEAGGTVQEWAETYCPLRNNTSCDGLEGRLESVVREPADQHPGVLVGFEGDTQALFPSWVSSDAVDALWTDPAPAEGGEIYVVMAWHPPDEYNARELAEQFSLNLCAACVEPELSPSAAP